MRHSIRILVFGAILLLVSCTSLGIGSYFSKGIPAYTGDGVIRDTSQPAVFFATRGYRIDLAGFRMDSPYGHSYVLKGVPVIDGTFASIFFKVPQGLTVASAGKAGASFEADLVDGKGNRVTRFGGPLNSFIWSGYSLYDLERSNFQPKQNEEYKLHVRFSPGSGVGGGLGHVYVRCAIGGS